MKLNPKVEEFLAKGIFIFVTFGFFALSFAFFIGILWGLILFFEFLGVLIRQLF